MCILPQTALAHLTPMDAAYQIEFRWDTLVTKLPDGSVKLTPRRPQAPLVFLGTREVMARTGLCKRQAQRIMHELGARQRRRNCTLQIEEEVLEKHLYRRVSDS